MIDKALFCGFAWYFAAALMCKEAWDSSHMVELICILISGVLLCVTTPTSSESVPTEFSTQRYHNHFQALTRLSCFNVITTLLEVKEGTGIVVCRKKSTE